MTARRISHVAAVLAGAHLLWFAFGGPPLWSPLPSGGEGLLRFALLLAAHLGALLSPAIVSDVCPGVVGHPK